jgi:acyl-CoA thioesterase-1
MNPKTMKLLALITTLVLAVLLAGPAHAAKRGQLADDPKLPRVLLIGDSISRGYMPEVRTLLEGKANVHRIPENGGSTAKGLKNLKAWLGKTKWDLIHFNWGLHDMKCIPDDPGRRADPKAAGSHRQVSIEDYEKNLRELVAQLKATGAKLIWCNTTPVPEGSDGRIAGEEVKYNEAAARVMKEAGIPTDDLNAHAAAKLKDVQLPANVHYSDAGYKYLAEKVAKEIAAALPRK